jgi:hypothetical protein
MPSSVVITCPTAAVPEIDGLEVFIGGAGSANDVRVLLITPKTIKLATNKTPRDATW